MHPLESTKMASLFVLASTAGKFDLVYGLWLFVVAAARRIAPVFGRPIRDQRRITTRGCPGEGMERHLQVTPPCFCNITV